MTSQNMYEDNVNGERVTESDLKEYLVDDWDKDVIAEALLNTRQYLDDDIWLYVMGLTKVEESD